MPSWSRFGSQFGLPKGLKIGPQSDLQGYLNLKPKFSLQGFKINLRSTSNAILTCKRDFQKTSKNPRENTDFCLSSGSEECSTLFQCSLQEGSLLHVVFSAKKAQNRSKSGPEGVLSSSCFYKPFGGRLGALLGGLFGAQMGPRTG